MAARDVFVNVAGGVRVAEPSADLGLCLALASSRLDLPIPADVAACGEVGLGGEVRGVSHLDLRVREAARLGFRRVLTPPRSGSGTENKDCERVPISSVAAAAAWVLAESPGGSV